MNYGTRFFAIMCITTVFSSVCIGGLTYLFERQHAIKEAQVKSHILLDLINTSTTYFESSQKPLVKELLKKNNKFYPELTNRFMILREYSDILQTKSHDHHFRLASLNPLNEKNKATPKETTIIGRFRSDPQLKKQDGLITQNHETVYFSASPITVQDNSCLSCHGKPENASRAQIVMYGTDNGYGWQKDETNSALFVYISLHQALQVAKKSAAKLFFISFACFLLTFLVIIIF